MNYLGLSGNSLAQGIHFIDTTKMYARPQQKEAMVKQKLVFGALTNI
ncbi:hypothetical protein tinsulaeT_03020 [Thalassotalea insulae]|uniref:Uncharacterized protein n=1 Tax=Thalassotalea insulae TaxID=2056778 RepID=A0ABQ6GM03_9GAMM|nr:hypothetical protein [Thalassotalea insulae]GLX76962.1 hypothetical protein tinsulaeT_03020 [Thalassotalea insulae]